MHKEFDRLRRSMVFLPSIVLESHSGHISHAFYSCPYRAHRKKMPHPPPVSGYITSKFIILNMGRNEV